MGLLCCPNNSRSSAQNSQAQRPRPNSFITKKTFKLHERNLNTKRERRKEKPNDYFFFFYTEICYIKDHQINLPKKKKKDLKGKILGKKRWEK